MPWTVTYDPTDDLVEVIYDGPVAASDLREATTRCIALGRERGSLRFLVDAERLELNASIFDLYELPARQYLAEGADRRSRVAVVAPADPRQRESVQFYQLASRNRGWLVEVFDNRDDAVGWLLAAETRA
jgi:hypothetical protein